MLFQIFKWQTHNHIGTKYPFFAFIWIKMHTGRYKSSKTKFEYGKLIWKLASNDPRMWDHKRPVYTFTFFGNSPLAHNLWRTNRTQRTHTSHTFSPRFDYGLWIPLRWKKDKSGRKDKNNIMHKGRHKDRHKGGNEDGYMKEERNQYLNQARWNGIQVHIYKGSNSATKQARKLSW